MAGKLMWTTADKVFASLFFLAIVAVLVASSSQTATAIQSFGNMITNLIGVIMGPATAAAQQASTPLGMGEQEVNSANAMGQNALSTGNSLIGR